MRSATICFGLRRTSSSSAGSLFPGSNTLTVHTAGLEETYTTPGGYTATRPNALGLQVLQRLNLLEVFNGSKFIRIAQPVRRPNRHLRSRAHRQHAV